MGIRRYKPNNAGRRNMSVSDFAELTKGAAPEKSLLRAKRRCNGRNNQGIITVRHRRFEAEVPPDRLSPE